MDPQDLTEQERALLAWLREMDDQHVSTGLLAGAFAAGWAACEARLRGLPAHDLLIHTHVHDSSGSWHEHEHAHRRPVERRAGPGPLFLGIRLPDDPADG